MAVACLFLFVCLFLCLFVFARQKKKHVASFFLSFLPSFLPSYLPAVNLHRLSTLCTMKDFTRPKAAVITSDKLQRRFKVSFLLSFVVLVFVPERQEPGL
jgi:hypothetical protein